LECIVIQRILPSIFFILPSILVGVSIAPSAAVAGNWSFQGLGDLPGGSVNSRARAVSADGSVVVGYGYSASGQEAFRWTSATGMVGLGDLPGGLDWPAASFASGGGGVSADGSVIVGFGTSASGEEAFRWTASGGMVGLGDVPGGRFYSNAYGVSADGSVVVGSSDSDRLGNVIYLTGNEAFRWTAESGMVGLGDLPGGEKHSGARGISADGSIIVGFGASASGDEAMRWTESGGMVGLGDLPGGAFESRALGISADGSVIVGWGQSGSGEEAFRWTSATGMVGLGDLPGGAFTSTAQATSADGSVIVGTSESSSGVEVFYWTQSTGMLSLKQLLTDTGTDLTGWSLTFATAISGDGNTIVGYGTNSLGQTEAWIATYAVPEPSSYALAALGAFGLAFFARRGTTGQR
jgi:probable HAF family extracellular repeat protein